MTIGELYRKPGIAFLDLDILVAWVLKQPKEFVYANPGYTFSATQLKKLTLLIKRRKAGEPIAYITGEKEFFGLTFKVDKRVLIPRPDTEHAVEVALQHSIAGDVICDVGTGAGCIAIAIKHTNPKLTVIATDISKPATTVAKQNAKLNNTKVKCFVGDVLKALPKRYEGKLDCIIFNAPYLTKQEAKKANLKYEPQVALTATRTGSSTHLYAKLIEQAPRFLKPHGKLVFEMGCRQAKAVSKLVRATFPKAKLEVIKDYGGYDRVVFAQL